MSEAFLCELDFPCGERLVAYSSPLGFGRGVFVGPNEGEGRFEVVELDRELKFVVGIRRHFERELLEVCQQSRCEITCSQSVLESITQKKRTTKVSHNEEDTRKQENDTKKAIKQTLRFQKPGDPVPLISRHRRQDLLGSLEVALEDGRLVVNQRHSKGVREQVDVLVGEVDSVLGRKVTEEVHWPMRIRRRVMLESVEGSDFRFSSIFELEMIWQR